MDNGVKAIRDLRKQADLTQYELSRLAGIDRTRVCLAESGHVQLRAEEITAIQHAVVSELQRKATEFLRRAAAMEETAAAAV